MSIVKMKKASIIVLNHNKAQAVQKLKDIGILHINLEKIESENLDKLLKEKDNLSRIVNLLNAEKDKVTFEKIDVQTCEAKISELDKILETIAKHQEELDKYDKEVKRIEDWGDFSPQDIAELKEKNVEVTLYEVFKPEYEAMENKKDLFLIKFRENVALVVAVNKKLDHIGNFELPTERLSVLQQKAKKEQDAIDTEQKKIVAYKKYLNSIKSYLKVLEDKIEFETVNNNLEDVEGIPLATITGFVPIDQVDALKTAAKQNGWGISLKDPDLEDKTPTLLKNAPLTRLIRPLTGFMELSPGYNESDISGFFLLFFTLFFAMIIGDAAYGLIFTAIGLIILVSSMAKGKGASQVGGLVLLLGLATVVYGMMTGTWFGTGLGKAYPDSIFAPLIPRLSTDQAFVQFVCFSIAVVHLTIAHVIGFVRLSSKGNVLKGIGYIGQGLMTLGLYYMVLSMVLATLDVFLNMQAAFPQWGSISMTLIGIGFFLVFVFSNQEKGESFGKGIMASVQNIISILLGVVSAFADIISYIRLFAVGMAGAAISDSFNDMALGIAGDMPGIGIVFAAMIMIFAHLLNIAMGLLSVLVHGVRLNVLEFSMHLGNEWAGIAYNPFKNKEIVLS